MTCASAEVTSIAEAEAVCVKGGEEAAGDFPTVAGVYAVYDPSGMLQYVGISRKIAVSIATHMEALPDKVGSVKVRKMPDASREELTEAWKGWVQEAGEKSSRRDVRRGSISGIGNRICCGRDVWSSSALNLLLDMVFAFFVLDSGWSCCASSSFAGMCLMLV